MSNSEIAVVWPMTQPQLIRALDGRHSDNYPTQSLVALTSRSYNNEQPWSVVKYTTELGLTNSYSTDLYHQ